MSGLARAFQEAAVVGEASRATADSDSNSAELAARLSALYRRGRAAHPHLTVTEAAFGACRARTGRAALERLAIEDLYLTCACATGSPGAAAIFEARFGNVIRRGVARALAARDERDEAE